MNIKQTIFAKTAKIVCFLHIVMLLYVSRDRMRSEPKKTAQGANMITLEELKKIEE